MANLVRWQCVASGLVQGVNYRARVADAARWHGIVGSVENRPDGTVFVDAQGDLGAIERFLETIRGPKGRSDARRVDRVAELAPSTELRTFSIRR